MSFVCFQNLHSETLKNTPQNKISLLSHLQMSCRMTFFLACAPQSLWHFNNIQTEVKIKKKETRKKLVTQMHLARWCVFNVQMHAVGGRSGRRRQRKCHWVISGREETLGGLCNIKSTLKNVRRTVVTKATPKHSHSDNSLSDSSQE